MKPDRKYHRVRASGICISDNKILLIHRINLELEKNKQEYYVIPGGGVESSEKTPDAVIREMKEETGLTVKLGTLFYEFEDHDIEGRLLKYAAYLCDYVSGEIGLGENSVEALEMKDGKQFYNPVWVPLSELQNIVLLPKRVKQELIAKYL